MVEKIMKVKQIILSVHVVHELGRTEFCIVDVWLFLTIWPSVPWLTVQSTSRLAVLRMHAPFLSYEHPENLESPRVALSAPAVALT